MKIVIAGAVLVSFIAPALAEALVQDTMLANGAELLASIAKDEGKRKAYCDLQLLLTKAEQALEKKNEADAKAFSNEAEAKSKELGDEFLALMAMQIDIDPSTEAGKKYFAAWESLEKSCPKS
jgi:hypothetical protein